jgi:uncharacterized membrane protein
MLASSDGILSAERSASRRRTTRDAPLGQAVAARARRALTANLIVIAVCKLLADRTSSPPVVVYARRLVIVTDLAFTATAMLVAVSG